MTELGRIIRGPCLILWLLSFFLFSDGLASQAQTSTPEKYTFKVFLDDDEIGVQRFFVSSDGTRSQVKVEAQFDVTYFLIPFYSYRHTNSETWEGNCLKEIRAETNDNGESFFVRGTRQRSQIRLHTHAGKSTLEGCIKTFAYWNLDLLQSDRLLNSQTGEWQRVQISKVGNETIPVRGVSTETEHHRIVSDKFTIDLWYTMDHKWVALAIHHEEWRNTSLSTDMNQE